MSIASSLLGKNNSLNLIRFVLASAVIFSHTFPIGGYEGHPLAVGVSLGGVAVGGFFIISGYLIAGSRVRLTAGSYFWRRALRILPAFWVCLIVVGFVFAPLAFLIAGEEWRPLSSARYFFSNSLLYIRQYGVEATLGSVPYPGVWNGSLWTLFYEFAAYLGAGILLTAHMVRRHAPVILGVLLTLATVGQPLAAGPLDVSTNLYLNALWLSAFFLAGMFIWSIADKIPASPWIAGLCLTVLCVIWVMDVFTMLAPLPMAYLLLWVGGALRTRAFTKNDISYGVYIYAFPVQQLLALAGLHEHVDPVVFSIITLAITAVFAFGSWKLVEQPAMKLKGLVRSKPRVHAQV